MSYEAILRYGQSTLPPVNRQMETDLAQRAREADAGARSEMIERNIRIAIHTAHRFTNTGIEIDDLVSIGTLGLIKAVDSFDPGKGFRFSTYAVRCIENEILMELRREKKRSVECSYDRRLPGREGSDGEGATFADMKLVQPDTADERLLRDDEIRELRSALGVLGVRERQVIRERYGLESGKKKTQQETAAVLHITQSHVSRVERKALGKLRAEIDRSEDGGTRDAIRNYA